MTPASRVLAAVVLLGSLGGCAGLFIRATPPQFHYWNKPGATVEEFNRDSAACDKEASPPPGNSIDDVAYRRCLSARGWTRAQYVAPPPPGWYRGIE
jgi:hypothetical protein